MLEDLIEISYKLPVLGVIAGVFFAGVGLYLSGRPSTAGTAVINSLFGRVCYLVSFCCFATGCIGYLMQGNRKRKQAAFYQSKTSLADLKRLSWKQFEDFTGNLFTKLGYSVEVTGGLKDGGIDLVVKKNNKTHFVQCKRYNQQQVTLAQVRDFYGAMSSQLNKEKGYFITTGTFTLDAQQFAEKNSIELIDGARLVEYMNMAVISEVPNASRAAAPRVESKLCPSCGALMVVRVAKQGANANKPFWGCTTFPKCRMISEYRTEG